MWAVDGKRGGRVERRVSLLSSEQSCEHRETVSTVRWEILYNMRVQSTVTGVYVMYYTLSLLCKHSVATGICEHVCVCVCVCVHQHCLESRTHSFQIGFPGPVFVCVSECLYRGLFCFLYQPCMQGFSKWLLKSVYMFILGCLLAVVYTHLTQVFSVIYSARVLYVYCRSIAIDKITYVFVCVCMCIL